MELRPHITSIWEFAGTLPRRRWFRVSVIAVAAFFLLTFLLRSAIISFYIHRKIDSFNKTYHATLTIDQIRVKGLSSLRLCGICLAPENGDTLFKADTLYATISFLRAITGSIRLRNLELNNVLVDLVRKDSTDNYSFLFFHRKKESPDDTAIVNYASRAKMLTDAVFDRIPARFRICNFTVEGHLHGHRVTVHCDDLSIRDEAFRTGISIREDSASAESLICEGSIRKGDRSASFRIFPADTGKAVVPYFGSRYHAGIAFDTVLFRVEGEERGDDMMIIHGEAGVTGLEVTHAKLAADKVRFGKAEVDYTLNFGPDYMEIDSSTLVTFQKLTFHPYLKYRQHPTKQITLKITKPQFPAEELFSSIPEGLFTNYNGVRVSGDLSWYLDLFVDLSMPDSLRFDTDLRRYRFSVLSYGTLDLMRINEPFPYTAYEHGLPVRTLMVGPENPNYRPLGKISPYLQVSVMGSEDGGFYQHRGFLMDAFRDAIIADIKEGRFVRGGSTITMQLVKNVFLQRNKTLGRKLEEVLLVWLIENQGLSTKDRMFEVYLNIIEWGPLIYGANEASHFYFSKDVSKLTLSEAIFMASVIPHPKWFMYSFDREGRLKESQAGFYRLLSGKMLKKGQITQQDYDQLVPDVVLKGPARLLLKNAGQAPADTLYGGDDDL